MAEIVLKKEEFVSFALRALYEKFGYLPYNMSKFEPYDLYSSNKDFLVGDGVITFNDTNGKLLALKPDVTLSIIKNTGEENCKVYYHENVYRISGATKEFKELMQVGLECIGEKGVYALYEAAFLAAASLHEISEKFVLNLSHLGVVSALLEEASESKAFQKEAIDLLAQKNLHEISTLCEKYGVQAEKANRLKMLVKTYGDMPSALEKLSFLCQGEKAKEAFKELKAVCDLLSKTHLKEHIRIDFSVAGNMKYYNGLVFKGFVDGVPESVLSGGQYDRLMEKMGRKTSAIGFAVYLDVLEGLHKENGEYDVDLLVLYNDETSPESVLQAVQKAMLEGKKVSAQREKGKIRFAELLDLTGVGKND